MARQSESYERARAYQSVQAALRRGTLVRPKQCTECGCHSRSRRIEAHHDDHSRPLEVEWLCSRCHGFRRKGLKNTVPKDLWRQVVAKAKRDGISLRALMLKLLSEWLQR